MRETLRIRVNHASPRHSALSCGEHDANNVTGKDGKTSLSTLEEVWRFRKYLSSCHCKFPRIVIWYPFIYWLAWSTKIGWLDKGSVKQVSWILALIHSTLLLGDFKKTQKRYRWPKSSLRDQEIHVVQRVWRILTFHLPHHQDFKYYVNSHFLLYFVSVWFCHEDCQSYSIGFTHKKVNHF